MRTYIFTNRERKVLEAYLTKSKGNGKELANILQKIKKSNTLFDDVYLYLQVKKSS
jgi:hypothetical protein